MLRRACVVDAFGPEKELKHKELEPRTSGTIWASKQLPVPKGPMYKNYRVSIGLPCYPSYDGFA